LQWRCSLSTSAAVSVDEMSGTGSCSQKTKIPILAGRALLEPECALLDYREGDDRCARPSSQELRIQELSRFWIPVHRCEVLKPCIHGRGTDLIRTQYVTKELLWSGSFVIC
jgi:hypothetical protein